jgi:hypothetical protein
MTTPAEQTKPRPRGRHGHRVRAILSVAALVAELAGCGGGGGNVSLTHAQAVSQVEHLISQTMARLTPQPKLQPYSSLSGDTNCEDSSGQQSSLVNVSRNYLLTGIAASDNSAIGEDIHGFWQKQGYKITESKGVGTAEPNINATTGDDYLLALQSNSEGTLMLGVTSPCAQPAN